MKKVLFSVLLLSFGTAGFCTTWTVSNSGFTFVPATITIVSGDSVLFELSPIHSPLAVDSATWNANDNTPLPGGFTTPLGGGLILPDKLGVGTHYYVCSVHYAMGMKGKIIVQDNSGVSNKQILSALSVYPNPAGNSINLNVSASQVGQQFLITDQDGREILRGKLTGMETHVDVSQVRSGVYLLQIVGLKGSAVKFVKN